MSALDQPPRANSVEDLSIPFEVGVQTQVLIDGQPIFMVVAYDCDAGTVIIHNRDADGRCFTDPGTGEAALLTLRGKVEARWENEP